VKGKKNDSFTTRAAIFEAGAYIEAGTGTYIEKKELTRKAVSR
jgi:hypothetical protein